MVLCEHSIRDVGMRFQMGIPKALRNSKLQRQYAQSISLS